MSWYIHPSKQLRDDELPPELVVTNGNGSIEQVYKPVKVCHDLGGTGANDEQVFNCDKCGCVLSLYDRDGTNTLCTSFVFDYPRFCPECGAEVDLRMTDNRCPQNNTRNEVWPETDWRKPMLVLVGGTETGRFEHSERKAFCPYCGADLRRERG